MLITHREKMVGHQRQGGQQIERMHGRKSYMIFEAASTSPSVSKGILYITESTLGSHLNLSVCICTFL